MSTERAGPGTTTILAAVLIFVETAFWLFAGGAMLIGAFLLSHESDDVSFIPVSVDAVRTILALIGALILVICAAAIVAGIGVLRRRAWARWMGIALFSVFGLLVLGTIVTAGENPEALGMAMSWLLFVFDALIVLLLALPATGRDFRPTPLGAPAEAQAPPPT